MTTKSDVEEVQNYFSPGLTGASVNCVVGSTGVGRTALLSGIAAQLMLELKQSTMNSIRPKLVVFNVGGTESEFYCLLRDCVAIQLHLSGLQSKECVDTVSIRNLDKSLLDAASRIIVRHIEPVNIAIKPGTVRKDLVEDWRKSIYTMQVMGGSVKGIIFDNFLTYCRMTTRHSDFGEHYVETSKCIKDNLLLLKGIRDQLRIPIWIDCDRPGKFAQRNPKLKPSVTETADCRFLHEHVDRLFSIGNQFEGRISRLDQLKPVRKDWLLVNLIERGVFAKCSAESRARFLNRGVVQPTLQIEQPILESIEEQRRIDDITESVARHATRGRSRRIMQIDETEF